MVTPRPDTLRILSIDHAAQDLDRAAGAHDAGRSRLASFKALAVDAAASVATGQTGFGVFLDGALGRAGLPEAARRGLWIARQYPHGTDIAPAQELARWPQSELVKVIADARPSVRTPLEQRLPEILRIAEFCRASKRALLIEALPGPGKTTAALVASLIAVNLAPSWWLVEAQSSAAAWHDVARSAGAPGECQGVLVIARSPEAVSGFARAAATPLVRGFVGGRAIFKPVLAPWLAGELDDAAARDAMASTFRIMCAAWDKSFGGPRR